MVFLVGVSTSKVGDELVDTSTRSLILAVGKQPDWYVLFSLL